MTSFFALVLDTLLGIALVFGWAGPFIAGAMHEVFVDWAILKRINRVMNDRDDPTRRPTESEWFALAITLVGSFDVSATEEQNLNRSQNQVQQTFADKVKFKLQENRGAYLFLKQTCTQLAPFRVQVGIPLVFYVSAYTYSLIDAQVRLGDNDTAHSIAFSLWYCTIVLVAITSSMILSIGAPKVIEMVMADHSMTSNGYKMKWMCERRLELWRWSQERIRDPQRRMVTLDDRYSPIFDEYYSIWSCFSAILILIVPWALAFTVSYLTPEIGVSCRSATVLAYACSQVFLIALWSIHSSPMAREARGNASWKKSRQWTKYLALWAVTGLYYIVGIVALCVTLGGTIMQLTGVYRNCICKAGIFWGLPTTRDRSMALVKLSTDTQMDRDAASAWLALGGTGVAWLVILLARGLSMMTRMDEDEDDEGEEYTDAVDDSHSDRAADESDSESSY
ncbi:hypothetical protein EDB81DRAFT_898894 [Dactylonectria macrodidyma]|uniref:Uncharacterized protein n=1 Tax=Dactylonectria macrodidyma TaxID=307937 RepID=A0A9P9EPY2_9HYPO|nr:hypothetical protein EDB81DRAFT_898894 [Dactylonectria macrodidyma]